jgi:cytosine/adenosine deaminase-related metal-dependent hydrolase
MKGPEWVPLYNPVQNLGYSASGSSVQTVIIDGRVVMDDHQIVTVDEVEVLARCQTLAEGVLARSGVDAIHSRWNIC